MGPLRVFVAGGTGKIGPVVIQELVNYGTEVTMYARSLEKIQQPQVPEVENIKHSISQAAYEAGVKQVVEMYAKARAPFPQYEMLIPHTLAEQKIYVIPNRGAYVTLRPTNFMSNMLYCAKPMKRDSILIDAAAPNEPQEWISTNDIGRVAARILIHPIEKHGDAAYEMIGDIKTPSERSAILSKVLGRNINYKQLSSQEVYDYYTKVEGTSHKVAYFMAAYSDVAPISRGLPILLGREPETFGEWAAKNKAFQ